MEIESYNWSNEYGNRVGICISDEHNKIMLWCSDAGYDIEGHTGPAENDVFVEGKLNHGTSTDLGETGHALGEVLYQMIGGYK